MTISSETNSYIHPTAIVEDGAIIGTNVKIWHFCHIRSGAVIGDGVSIGRDCYIDSGVSIGKFSRIQNGVSIYNGVDIKDYCFIGPHVIFTNDMSPRVLKKNWKTVKTVINTGGSLGAGSIIRCGVSVGSFSMIGAGSLVTKNIEPFTLHIGFPSKVKSFLCACGDTQFALDCFHQKTVVKDCCLENLPIEMLEVANQEISKLADEEIL